MRIICPVCCGEVDGEPDGKQFVVKTHEVPAEGGGTEECGGTDSYVGDESIVKGEAA